ncbi:MAG: hypothetical protein ACLFM0_02905 [Spirochaetales bacterium]
MTEMMRHVPGKIFLSAILVSVIAFIAISFTGILDEPTLLFGWMTPPLWIGMAFTIFWLICYLIYFFFFWPFR